MQKESYSKCIYILVDLVHFSFLFFFERKHHFFFFDLVHFVGVERDKD